MERKRFRNAIESRGDIAPAIAANAATRTEATFNNCHDRKAREATSRLQK